MWYFNFGVNYELGISNILNCELNDKIISEKQGDYNSLLYRQDKVEINSTIIKLGITYMF